MEMENSTRQKPTFVWQGIFLLVPMLACASLGMVSVRRDYSLAWQEAKESAQKSASRLTEAVT